ncbi:DUF3696 domain-containing protein, partial [Candidatus Frankia alpina]
LTPRNNYPTSQIDTGNGSMPANEAVLHYFGVEGRTAIDVTESGALSSWPQGFFDQSERDLASLAGLRRRRR